MDKWEMFMDIKQGLYVKELGRKMIILTPKSHVKIILVAFISICYLSQPDFQQSAHAAENVAEETVLLEQTEK